MWEPLQDLLASSSDDMKVQALWVIGTAVQNNPAAQKSVRSTLSHSVPRKARRKRDAYSPVHGSQYLALDPLPTILSFLSPLASSSQQLRSKAIYTLSGVLNHNAAAISLFEASGGWDTLRDAFSGTVYRIPHPPTHPSATLTPILTHHSLCPQTQISPSGARPCFSSTASSRPLP
jgi:hypothetical protein